MADYYEDDEVFRDINSFYKRLMERMFREMEDLERAVRNGQIRGTWDVRPIRRQGARGYVAQGQFQLGDRPIGVPQHAIEKSREPLTDVFDEKENVKVYIELPGVDKNDIKLDVMENTVEVRAKNFARSLELPTRNIDSERAVANYKNGVLELTIPKIKVAEDEKKRTIKIE